MYSPSRHSPINVHSKSLPRVIIASTAPAAAGSPRPTNRVACPASRLPSAKGMGMR